MGSGRSDARLLQFLPTFGTNTIAAPKLLIRYVNLYGQTKSLESLLDHAAHHVKRGATEKRRHQQDTRVMCFFIQLNPQDHAQIDDADIWQFRVGDITKRIPQVSLAHYSRTCHNNSPF